MTIFRENLDRVPPCPSTWHKYETEILKIQNEILVSALLFLSRFFGLNGIIVKLSVIRSWFGSCLIRKRKVIQISLNKIIFLLSGYIFYWCMLSKNAICIFFTQLLKYFQWLKFTLIYEIQHFFVNLEWYLKDLRTKFLFGIKKIWHIFCILESSLW